MTPNILIGSKIGQKTLDKLRQKLPVDCLPTKEHRYEQVLERIEAYDALLVMGHSADKTLMDKGTKLQLLSNYGVGYDNIDIAYAREKGIAVSNLPRSTCGPTATQAMALTLALLRKIVLNDRRIRQHTMPGWGTTEALGNSPAGKTLGILGMGRIGKELARRAKVFGMRILYHNRNRLSMEEEYKYQASYASFAELLQQSDVLSIHAPLTPETQHMIDAAALAQMKPSAFLINTARGGLVDQQAILHALQTQQIAGAGLDVFANEPEIPEAFWSLDNVILSPHNGTGTIEDRRAMFEEAWENIVAFFEGRHEEVARVV